MNVRMGLIRKRANWTDEDFRSYWLNQHGPLAAGARGLRSYWQNVVIDRSQRGIDFMRGPWDFDGFSQLWFDDERRPNQPFGDGELETRLIADEKYFLDDLHIITARQHEVIATPQSVPSQLPALALDNDCPFTPRDDPMPLCFLRFQSLTTTLVPSSFNVAPV